MKIEKFTKLKENKYKVVFDNELEVTLYDDVIVKYNLLVNKVMDNKEFKEVTTYNDSLDAYYKSIKYINRKLRTKKEIFKYLEKDFDNKIINDTIKKLEHDGYLNENIYVKSYINDHVNLTLNGPHKIIKELVKLGISEDNIYPLLNNIDDDVWISKVTKLVNKRVKSNHNYSCNKLKDKIVTDLINLGYKKDMIMEVLSNTDIVIDSSLVIKEGTKIYNKLSRKYTDNELIYHFKNKMYLKGFSGKEVEEFFKEYKF